MNKKSYGTTLSDNLGYAFGDFGMQAVFGLVASVLQKYYTDVLMLPIASVMILFIAARIWDAVNDPMWGAFIDSRPSKADGRYRRFIKYFSIPMALSTLLMFVNIPGLDTTGRFIFACITYIMFGMIYTCVNVPYGSLASVITTDDRERTRLSTYRSMGSAIGAVPGLLLIVLCYTTEDGEKVMSYTKIIIGVAVISLIAAVFTLLSQKMVKERVITPPKPKTDKREHWRKIFKIVSNRPFIALSVSAMLYLAASVFSQSYYTYLADRYFGMSSFSMLAMLCQYLPLAIAMPLVGKLTRKFGRKEICAWGLLLAGGAYLALYFMQTVNPWIFLVFCFIAGIGNSFMFLQVWALATETVDYNRITLGFTDDAVSYSLFSFIRKLGHAVSAIFVNASLLGIGYSTENLTDESLKGMYDSSVLIPAILYFAVFIILNFFYPLGKKRLAEIRNRQTETE